MVNKTFMFSTGHTQSCVDVTIVNDSDDEPDENFFYTLEMTPDLHPNVSLYPTRGEVEIGLYIIMHEHIIIVSMMAMFPLCDIQQVRV